MIRVSQATVPLLRRQDYGAWLEKAAERTDKNREAEEHLDSEIWREIKPLLADLQLGKCGYCERWLSTAGNELAVDHFRPKKRVTKWTKSIDGDIDVGGDDARGYFLLAFDLQNYLAACDSCNSRHKRSYFPTCQPRKLGTTSPEELWQEQPYLINPADPLDADPETLIKWDGIWPRPVHDDGPERARARVTIAVLALSREELLVERARVIRELWGAYQGVITRTGDVRVHQFSLETVCEQDSPHSSCARAFRQLCYNDRAAAQEKFEEAIQLLERIRRRRLRKRRDP
jgi:hypothetical protein